MLDGIFKTIYKNNILTAHYSLIESTNEDIKVDGSGIGFHNYLGLEDGTGYGNGCGMNNFGKKEVYCATENDFTYE